MTLSVEVGRQCLFPPAHVGCFNRLLSAIGVAGDIVVPLVQTKTEETKDA